MVNEQSLSSSLMDIKQSLSSSLMDNKQSLSSSLMDNKPSLSSSLMDRALEEAATNGDVNFLIKAICLHPCSSDDDYFLTQFIRANGNTQKGNIFHISIRMQKVEFVREAIQRLPNVILNQLLLHEDNDGWTPLHTAVLECENSPEMVTLILNYYKSMPSDDVGKGLKPWLALTEDKETPLHLALGFLKSTEENAKSIAMELLMMDVELLCNMVDDEGNSPLLLAVNNNFDQIAKTILLKSRPFSSISFSGSGDLTPLHLAPYSSVNIFELMLKHFGKCIDKINERGYSVLHAWAKIGEVWPCKVLLESNDFPEVRTKIFKDLVCLKENLEGNTPLHIAAMNNKSEFGQILVRGYQLIMSESKAKNQDLVSVECLPWKVQNKDGDTPLTKAMRPDGSHELVMDILSIDPTTCHEFMNNKGESLFFVAVRLRCESLVDKILEIEEPRCDKLQRNDGSSVLHFLYSWPEKTGTRLLGKYWWMASFRDDKRRTPLDKAKYFNAPWLVNLLIKPSLILKEPFDWITACQREETSAILGFIINCHDLQMVCREQKDTPLHHIKLPAYKDYQNLLTIPSIIELKNITDRDGSTPLHRALERKDMLLSKVLLLEHGVERTISNHNGYTAMTLLADLCNRSDDWDKMCKKIMVYPHMKTMFIKPGTNLEQIRNTLSVVAALLATITFAAGFTLPGGINSNTGEALLAKKAAFLVFLLADVYAMCTSMLVLLWLVWSIVSEPDMARLLVDRSVHILMQSLYATLLTFMTGIYAVVSHGSLWVAILIFVMCSCIGISANKAILHKVIVKMMLAPRKRKKDPLSLVEEGGIAESSTWKGASNKTD